MKDQTKQKTFRNLGEVREHYDANIPGRSWSAILRAARSNASSVAAKLRKSEPVINSRKEK